MRAHPAQLSLLVVVLVFCLPAAYGQSWLDAVKNEAASTATSIATGTADSAIRCVVTDQACIDAAQTSGKEVVVTNKKGKPLPPDQQPKSAASGGTAKSDSSAAASGAAAGGQSGGQPNLTAVKSDFVPGEKTIFFDDFTDMTGDEPPPHWKVRGGTAELRTGAGVRQLTLATNRAVLVPNLKGLPRNFTLEADLKFDNVGSTSAGWYFIKKDGYEALMVDTMVQTDNTFITEVKTGDPRDAQELVGKVQPTIDWRKPIQQALWVQDGRIRLYVNGVRLIDANQIKVDEIESIEFRIGLDDTANCSVGLRRVRFAETAPDIGKSIMSSGRYVTHGILFDTDSDRIKPESAPVIKKVAEALQANGTLELLIEGYTDSSGDAAHNIDLSKRRAEAVKAVLVSQFGIDAVRLTTNGLGASKPVTSNDTPQGRAENRRVEFVKQ